ncbi:MAG: polyprenyl synthetase family protein [Anaerolineales bacterium]|nr:polyprenyl synthetase family protein [Anaerolineales bacterium]
MSFKQFSAIALPEIEKELQAQIARLNQPRLHPFHAMLTYHMGWTGEGAGPEAAGKRIRPLLVLLAVSAARGAAWQIGLPAAAAVELVHNFSLVHDDVQDNSDKRRGRPTAWKKWGVPMAINVGDALFVIGNQAILDLGKTLPASTVTQAASILSAACLDLTRGQYLDMSYEGRTDLGLDEYWPMIGGKTSALLAACAELGALIGGANAEEREGYRLFGHHLGLAFQVQDDALGIWGDESVTGKSAASDLVEGKNSLPILFALEKIPAFAKRWAQGSIQADEVAELAALLEREGAKTYALETAQRETEKALTFLEKADPGGEAGETLLELANMLLKRKQ